MASGDIECKGCSSYNESEGLYCSLKPVYNQKQCPCLTCLVKPICMADDSECKIYHDFARNQNDDDENNEWD